MIDSPDAEYRPSECMDCLGYTQEIASLQAQVAGLRVLIEDAYQDLGVGGTVSLPVYNRIIKARSSTEATARKHDTEVRAKAFEEAENHAQDQGWDVIAGDLGGMAHAEREKAKRT